MSKVVRYYCDGCGDEVSFLANFSMWRFFTFRPKRLCQNCVNDITVVLNLRKTKINNERLKKREAEEALLRKREDGSYRNFYKCSCGESWDDVWSCMCNDKCPKCNKEIEPYKSVGLGENKVYNYNKV